MTNVYLYNCASSQPAILHWKLSNFDSFSSSLHDHNCHSAAICTDFTVQLTHLMQPCFLSSFSRNIAARPRFVCQKRRRKCYRGGDVVSFHGKICYVKTTFQESFKLFVSTNDHIHTKGIVIKVDLRFNNYFANCVERD